MKYHLLKRIGSGCGSVGRVVVPNTKELQDASSHQQISFTINCIEKTKTKKKETGNGHFFLNFSLLTQKS